MPDTAELSEILAREVPEEGRRSMFIALWEFDGRRPQTPQRAGNRTVAAILGIGANRGPRSPLVCCLECLTRMELDHGQRILDRHRA